jgi:Rieske Fe-S protein
VLNRREFIKQAVTTTVLFAVSSVGLAELLVKAKSPVGVRAPTVLQVPATTPPNGLGSSSSGNQTAAESGSTAGSSSGSAGSSSGGPAGGSGGSAGSQGGSSGSSGSSGNTSSGSAGTAQPPSGYIYLAAVSAVAGTSAYFNHPSGGSCLLVDYNGVWRAFSAICTHSGCVCNFTGSALYCPCHGASFSAANGAVNSGPTKTPLAEYDIQVVNGAFYVSPGRIN